jgi:hypothetical protein
MSGSGKWSGKGPAWGAVLGLAATVVGDWRNSRRAKKAIVHLFDECFLGEDGYLKPGAPTHLEVADLVFTLGQEQHFRNSRRVCLRKVTVKNTKVPGDDPAHLRTFHYWYNMRLHNHRRLVSISWGKPGSYFNYRR